MAGALWHEAAGLWLGEVGAPEVKEESRLSRRDGVAHRVLSFRTPGLIASTVEWNGQTFTRITAPGVGVSPTVGQPELPVYRKLLFLGRGGQLTAKGSVCVERELVLREYGLPATLFPRLPPIPKIPGALEAAARELREVLGHGHAPIASSQQALGRRGDEAQMNDAAPALGEGLPVAQLVDLGILRGQHAVLLEVFPVAFDVKAGIIKLREIIEVEIRLENSSPPAENQSLGLLSGIRREFSGDGQGGSASISEVARGRRLLIVATNRFIPWLGSFVAHKESRGWMVEVIDTALTGATAVAIRSAIQARYVDPSSRPTHLLLVGDTDTIPAWSGRGAYRPATDLYYACMDGTNDWLPDMAYARFPARTETQLTNMMAKAIAYETLISCLTPYVRNAAFVSSEDNYALTEATHNWVVAQYMAPRGYQSQKLYKHAYGATTAMVTNTINAGCSLVTYSGHGGAQEWLDPLVRNRNVLALTNEMRLPFVMSFACDTGSYRDYDESFAEAWLRTAARYGAVAILAASEDTYWEEDDIFQKAMFASIFEDNETILGNSVLRAKERYLSYYGIGPETLQYFEQYNLFGDPTLQLIVLGAVPVLSASGFMPDGSFEFTVTGIPGRTYAVECSSNLVDWTAFTTFVGTNAVMYLRDPGATNYTRRFYRALEVH